MTIDKELSDALELCGFISGEKQESRLMNILSVILRLQTDPPIPLTFSEIYEQLEKEDPGVKLTRAWIHKVLKGLIDAKLIRVDNPAAHRKKYIADVNTVMAGLEFLKSVRIGRLNGQSKAIQEEIESINALDCGTLAKKFIADITGTQQEISSRVVRGVEELHRILRYNMLDIAGKGDIIRATALWLGPFVDGSVKERTRRFIDAAERGADVRYMVSTEVFSIDKTIEERDDIGGLLVLIQHIIELREKGVLFDLKIYEGAKTYNQVSFNNQSMALIITENPVTATWITRQFNPDLIDNAVASFDQSWKHAKSFWELKPKDIERFGILPSGIITQLISPNKERDSQENM